MVYFIGDSHVSFIGHNDGKICSDITSTIPYVNKYVHITTAYYVYTLVDFLNDAIKTSYNLSSNDWLAFQFGEIDVRFYIPKDMIEGRDPEISFQRSVGSYESFIIEMKKHTNNIIICAIWPAAIEENELIPTRGFLSREVRQYWATRFNEELKHIAERQNAEFLDMTKYLVDENNMVNRSLYCEDLIHIKHKCTSFFKIELDKILAKHP
jgi:lysophospholipase L1-like esterase